jgi:hypothetical protein
MADILIHPSAIEDDSEEFLQEVIDFYVRIGLVEPGSKFVADPSQPQDEQPEGKVDVLSASACHGKCRTAYDIATRACNLIPVSSVRRRCRRKAEAAYRVCIAICDLAT